MDGQREKAIGYGYIITDPKGRVQLNTLRSNRSACWKSFTGNFSKKQCKKMGWECVPVWVKEHVSR